MDFVEKVKGFFMEPSKTFDASREDTLNDALKYYAVIVVIYAVLFALLLALAFSFMSSFMGFGQLGMVAGAGAGLIAMATFVMLLIAMIVGAFVSGAILHIFVYIVGGRKGITQTIKAVMYGSTPGLLLGWIPFINVIGWIWSLVLEVLGIRQYHELTTGKAILAVLIPILIVLVIYAAVIAAFLSRMGPEGAGF